MCFANSAYLLLHTNLINKTRDVTKEIMNVDGIAFSAGYKPDLGVTITEGRLQNIERKVKDSLHKMGHKNLSISLKLDSEINVQEMDQRLNQGEFILAGFSTGIYNRYFRKSGVPRPCIATFETTGLDFSPPHYVILFSTNETDIRILDPYCKYSAERVPMPLIKFANNNSNKITTLERRTFLQKIMFGNMMDGIDYDNRELIYADVIMDHDEEKRIKSSKLSGSKFQFQDSLDKFSKIIEEETQRKRGGSDA